MAFTQLFNETFSGADANPIDPAKWGEGLGVPFQQLNHVLVNSNFAFGCNQNYIGIAWPVNQYVDVGIHVAINVTDCEIVIRSDAQQNNCYVFYVDSQGDGTADSALLSYVGGLPTEILDFGFIPFSADDVFRFAAFGTTLYAFRNGVLLGSVNNIDHASGKAGLFMTDSSGITGDVTDLQIGRFAGGSVSNPFGQIGSIISCTSVRADGWSIIYQYQLDSGAQSQTEVVVGRLTTTFWNAPTGQIVINSPGSSVPVLLSCPDIIQFAAFGILNKGFPFYQPPANERGVPDVSILRYPF
jgi:hypothetical protein